MTIGQAAQLIRERKVSAVELTSEAFGRIQSLNPKLNAFLTLMEESARERARQADEELSQGRDLGPLHGIPVAVKDVFKTAGVRTTCGSKLFENYVPAHDCAVVERLRSAGAVLIGKTGLHELAYGVTSNNPHFGAIRNPWNTDCVPGGSSGGSGAAVGAGMVFMAMGSDTGGSIRIPAAFCGTTGLKPTFGRVSRFGVMPLDFTLDHMGPLTRSVRDAALVLNVLAGFDPRDDTSSLRAIGQYCPAPECSIRGLRIGIPEKFFFDRIDADVEKAVGQMVQVAESLGAQVAPVSLPDLGAINAVARVILMAEASALMEPFLNSRRDDIGADVRALLDQGRFLAATDYVNAQRLRRVYQRQFNAVWDQVDCLITPTTPISAPKIGAVSVLIDGEAEDTRLASTLYVRGINLLGLPALSMPCGLDRHRMPVSLQIIGPPFGEALILLLGAALEQATDFHKLAPPL